VKLLLADRDADVLDVTTYALRRYGFEVVAARDGRQALRYWKDLSPDLVLADIDLPGIGGFELCREIRQTSSTPVILLSARNTDDDVVRGFQSGADDFVVKPLSHRQLAMRIRAILHRSSRADSSIVEGGELRAGRLRLDLESHEVSCANRVVRLTPIEFRVFYLLMLNAGHVVSTVRLIEHAWGYNGADAGTLKMHVSRIRQKFEQHGLASEYIESVRWVGYVLRENEPTRSGNSSSNQSASAR